MFLLLLMNPTKWCTDEHQYCAIPIDMHYQSLETHFLIPASEQAINKNTKKMDIMKFTAQQLVSIAQYTHIVLKARKKKQWALYNAFSVYEVVLILGVGGMQRGISNSSQKESHWLHTKVFWPIQNHQ